MGNFRLTAPQSKEKAIENAILSYYFYLGFEVWQNPSTGMWDKNLNNGRGGYRKAKSKFSNKSTSDIFALAQKFIATEVKTPEAHRYIEKHIDMLRVYVGPNKTKIRYRDQIKFLDRVNARGHIGFFASSVEDVKLKLIKEGILKDESNNTIKAKENRISENTTIETKEMEEGNNEGSS